MYYEKLINKYFNDKDISFWVKDTVKSDNYITFILDIDDLNDLKKINNKMEKELSYVLKSDITFNYNKDGLSITLNDTKKEAENLSGIVLDFGHDTRGDVVSVDFKNNPHWLIGGSTGSGKSVFLNNVISDLLFNYCNDIMFLFIDLKQVEFARYNNLCVNLKPVANNIDEALKSLETANKLMQYRYNLYKENNVLNIQEYNEIAEETDRYLFVVIDELAELMLQAKKQVQPLLQSLLQLGRAAGIYVICATQRPSADVISGLLKVNFTTRICFKVGNMYDSKTILNRKGAELLAGNGDGLLLKNGDTSLIRFQGKSPKKDDLTDFYIIPDEKEKRKKAMLTSFKNFDNNIKSVSDILNLIINSIVQFASVMLYIISLWLRLMLSFIGLFRRR